MRNLRLPLTQQRVLIPKPVELPVVTTGALDYLIYLMFDRLPFFIRNFDLYTDCVKWKEFAKYPELGDVLLPRLFSLRVHCKGT